MGVDMTRCVFVGVLLLVSFGLAGCAGTSVDGPTGAVDTVSTPDTFATWDGVSLEATTRRLSPRCL